MQSSLTQGLQTKSIIDGAEQGRKLNAQKDADKERMVVDERTSSAAVAGAKADAPGATNEHKLASISKDLTASAQVDTAVETQAKSDKANRTNDAPKLAQDNLAKQASLRESAAERAQDLADAATRSEGAIKKSKDPAAARATAQRNFDAASSAYEMLAKHESSRPARSPEDAEGKAALAKEYSTRAAEFKIKSNKLGGQP